MKIFLAKQLPFRFLSVLFFVFFSFPMSFHTPRTEQLNSQLWLHGTVEEEEGNKKKEEKKNIKQFQLKWKMVFRKSQADYRGLWLRRSASLGFKCTLFQNTIEMTNGFRWEGLIRHFERGCLWMHKWPLSKWGPCRLNNTPTLYMADVHVRELILPPPPLSVASVH